MKLSADKKSAQPAGMIIRTGFFILAILFSLPAYSFQYGDSTKTKYPIDDPRNPDCPCHKYQKLAEDEYKRMTSTGSKIANAENDPGRISDQDQSRNKFHEKHLRRHRRKNHRQGRECRQKKVWDCVHFR